MSREGMIVIGGLPGMGKSTVALPLARRLGAAYLRIDTIEQALNDSGELEAPAKAAGYIVGYATALDQLQVGLTVVVECVNPLKITRDAWRAAAERRSTWILEVELICSDRSEHRTRVQSRDVDIPGLTPPTWRQVTEREYEPWDRDHLVLDTALLSVTDSVSAISDKVCALISAGR
jgi:predicted kinase